MSLKHTLKRKAREKRMALAKAGAATVVHLKGFLNNTVYRRRAANIHAETDMKQKMVAGMTNWQRHQWRRAVAAGKQFLTDTDNVFKADSAQGAQYFRNADRRTRQVVMEGKVLGHV